MLPGAAGNIHGRNESWLLSARGATNLAHSARKHVDRFQREMKHKLMELGAIHSAEFLQRNFVSTNNRKAD